MGWAYGVWSRSLRDKARAGDRDHRRESATFKRFAATMIVTVDTGGHVKRRSTSVQSLRLTYGYRLRLWESTRDPSGLLGLSVAEREMGAFCPHQPLRRRT